MQIENLRYSRLQICATSETAHRRARSDAPYLQQITNLRYFYAPYLWKSPSPISHVAQQTLLPG
ncbi:hypothetical protein SBV1_3130014 [Verrucomicrobia bacterium]|nr:hypothetical protein SBV1_3130014 [Verrucomicrobiota bacterium]